jgi:hypothetical protein
MEALSGDPGVPEQGVGFEVPASNVAIGEYIAPFATSWCTGVVQKWTTTTTSFSTKGVSAPRSTALFSKGIAGTRLGHVGTWPT